MSSSPSSSSARRPRMNWGILSRLRSDATNSGGAPPPLPLPPNPEPLLHHLESAIATLEYAQASRHLHVLLPTRSTPSPQGFASAVAQSKSRAHGSDLPCLNAASRPMSRFSPARQEAVSTHARTAEDVSPANTEPSFVSTEGTDRDELANAPSSLSGPLGEGVPGNKASGHFQPLAAELDDRADGSHDAQAADEAYRAGCAAVSERKPDLALALFRIARKKCPPDKHLAFGKIQKLIAVTSQMLEKQESGKG